MPSRRDEGARATPGDDLALGASLVAAGRITPEQLAECLRAQRLEGGPERVRLRAILVRLGLVSAAEAEQSLRQASRRLFRANYAAGHMGRDDGFSEAAPVGQFPAGASPYGALDLAGNVWEWTATTYRDDGYATRDPLADDFGGGARVGRGGAWSFVATNIRCSFRLGYLSSSRNSNIGFRAASVARARAR